MKSARVTAVVPHPGIELERLYIEHGEQVRGICGSILRNRHEAEDAAQQVFVAAFRALRGGTVPGRMFVVTAVRGPGLPCLHGPGRKSTRLQIGLFQVPGYPRGYPPYAI